ncbi:33 kDa ribonucleoprotein, chloroplastic-like [Actinidia eriantha]|uniref:33 kDa ribonucleoprotein, chloroplastic-like n=1 Tax=Actinidia eriantha TaxID=165200 RepID=UPI00258D2367|nr:33 kDa ribonucleoprotein, chloroplastic-like [Actinidia eriantha]
MEAACSLFSSCLPSSPSLRLHISTSNLALSVKSPPYPFPRLCQCNQKIRKLQSFLSVGGDSSGRSDEKTQLTNPMRKLCVQNLPWSFAVDDMKTVFGECGTVADIEIIKQKDGKSRGFAFVTMDSGEEAQAVIDKFNSQELLGRVIRVEFAKRFQRPPRPPSASPPVRETWHKLYVSNLAWKVRSSHLKDFFAADFNPVSTRVVCDSPSGKSAGYGFVSFATKEVAESAISALDGKELLCRSLRLKFSEKNIEVSVDGKDKEDISEEPQQS